MLCEQLWSRSSSAPTVEGGLACYDVILHYITVTGSAAHNCSHPSSPYSAHHQFKCATSVGVLLQWLLPKLSPGSRITVLPVFEWLLGLITGPLNDQRAELLCVVAKIVGLSDHVQRLALPSLTEELKQGLEMFLDLTQKEGRKWDLLLMTLEVETRRHGVYLPRHRAQLPKTGTLAYRSEDTDMCVYMPSECSASVDRDGRWLSVLVSALFELGMDLSDLPGDVVHHLLLPYFSGLLETLVSRGLDVWIKDSAGTPLLCSAVQHAFPDTLRILLRDVTTDPPDNHSDKETKSSYHQQVEDSSGDEWDLWSLAADCGGTANALVLHEHGIPASRRSLMHAAVQGNQKMLDLCWRYASGRTLTAWMP